jgi:serine/threonine-protein kinase RsbW
VSSVAAQAATWYQRTFHGRPDQVARVRREIAAHLEDCPAADDAVLIASELAANSVTHSASQGQFFTVRCQAYPGYVWIECEDLGGEWQRKPGDDRPHGLDIIRALVGPDNWGTETTGDGDRIVWARLELPRDQHHDRTGPARA